MKRRHRVAVALAVTATVAGGSALAAGGQDPVAPRPAAPRPVAAPVGLRAELTDTRAAAPGRPGLVAWGVRWRLTWEPVPGATAYVLRFSGPEGPDPGPGRRLELPQFELEVARGLDPPSRLDRARALQLGYRSTQLAVTVAAVAADGTVGPATAALPVGGIT